MQEPARGRGPHEQTLTGRLSINQLTLDQSTFEEDLESCRRIGASGIGIVENKLGDGRDQELAELIEGAGLQATLCTAGTPTLLPVALFGGPTDPQVRIEQLIASIARFAPFRPAQFITLTGVDDSLSDADQRRTVVDGYRRVSAAAADVGALVGIEPIRRSAAADASLVVTVAETADLVAEIDAPNVGIIYDVFHHWDSPTLLGTLRGPCVAVLDRPARRPGRPSGRRVQPCNSRRGADPAEPHLRGARSSRLHRLVRRRVAVRREPRQPDGRTRQRRDPRAHHARPGSSLGEPCALARSRLVARGPRASRVRRRGECGRQESQKPTCDRSGGRAGLSSPWRGGRLRS